jgi:hypothetical protein
MGEWSAYSAETSATVTLGLQANDPEPGSGIAKVHFRNRGGKLEGGPHSRTARTVEKITAPLLETFCAERDKPSGMMQGSIAIWTSNSDQTILQET